MLDRIKRKQLLGFKEFVLNMETTGPATRQNILMAGILEDPKFMAYVMRNIKTFHHVLELPTEELEKVLSHQEQIVGVMAKCIFGEPDETIKSLETSLPRYSSRLKDEISYLNEVSASEKEGAKYYILKIVRKLQMNEEIHGFSWDLPPQDFFHPKVLKDGKCQIHFDSGILAAEGEILKGKRTLFWKHYYDSGSLLAEGEYNDGLKTGSWTFFYGNQKPKAEGYYRFDLKHGHWKEWDRSGVLAEVEYNEGVKVAKP